MESKDLKDQWARKAKLVHKENKAREVFREIMACLETTEATVLTGEPGVTGARGQRGEARGTRTYWTSRNSYLPNKHTYIYGIYRFK